MGSHGGKPHIPLLILEMGLQEKTVRMESRRWGSKLALALIIASLLLPHFSLASGQIHHRKGHSMALFTIVLCAAINVIEKFTKINDRKEKI